MRLVAFTAACVQLLAVSVGAQDNTFEISLDLLASDTGYFKVAGYEGVQPTLVMERGTEYTFSQADPSNWFHPLGFAYFPDGAHEGVDELEAEVGNGDAPVYYINGQVSDLDTYEPEFFYPRDAWISQNYSVRLTVTDPDVTEIFYFCHIHNAMSARIFVVDSLEDPLPAPVVELYEPYEPDAFDEECGTFMASAYEPAAGTFESDLCPDQIFLCGDVDDSFDRCMHAIDCKMNYEMRVLKNSEVSNAAAFVHQMVPHHENAVNMAKVLLKNPPDEGLDEEFEAMLLEIVNTQNAQITYMRGWLAENGGLEAMTCEDDHSEDSDVPVYMIAITTVLGVAAVVALGAALYYRRLTALKSSTQKAVVVSSAAIA